MNFQCAALVVVAVFFSFCLFHWYAMEHLTTLCNTLNLDDEEEEEDDGEWRRLRDVNKSAARV